MDRRWASKGSVSGSIGTSCEDSQSQNVSELVYEDLSTKRVVKKKRRKTKESPVDEESLQTGQGSDYYTEDLSNEPDPLKSSPPDEDLLLHLVLSKILNRKKMQLLETGEIRQAIATKMLKKEKEK